MAVFDVAGYRSEKVILWDQYLFGFAVLGDRGSQHIYSTRSGAAGLS